MSYLGAWDPRLFDLELNCWGARTAACQKSLRA